MGRNRLFILGFVLVLSMVFNEINLQIQLITILHILLILLREIKRMPMLYDWFE